MGQISSVYNRSVAAHNERYAGVTYARQYDTLDGAIYIKELVRHRPAEASEVFKELQSMPELFNALSSKTVRDLQVAWRYHQYRQRLAS